MADPETYPTAGDEPPWLKSLQHSLPVVLIVLVVAIFGGFKTFWDGFEQVLVLTRLKPDALELGQDTARGQFSDQLMRLAWRRVFWTRRYVSALNFGLPASEQAEIWKGYMASVEEWNVNAMVNIVGLESYYGLKKRTDFDNGIMPSFNGIHDCLLRLKYPAAFKPGNQGCAFDEDWTAGVPATPQAIEEHLDDLNARLYCFASGLSKNGGVCYVAILRCGRRQGTRSRPPHDRREIADVATMLDASATPLVLDNNMNSTVVHYAGAPIAF